MWNNQLKHTDHAAIAKQTAILWGAETDSIQIINEGINFVYCFTVAAKNYYLRLIHSSNRSYVDLMAAVDYQRHVYEHGAPVCQPICSQQDLYIETIQYQDHTYLASVVAAVPGTQIHFDYAEDAIYFTWGKALAKLHLAAKSYQPIPHATFKSWQDLWQETAEYVDSEDSIIKNEYAAINHWLTSLTNSKHQLVLTHGDHRVGNVIYDGQQVYIIDFDEPVYHWPSADIARPIIDCLEQSILHCHTKLVNYLAGYQSILATDHELIQYIPWFVRMKILDIYLWTKYNWQDTTAPGGNLVSEQLSKLRHEIEHSTQLDAWLNIIKPIKL